MEGMLEIVLNLKQVRFIKTVESVDSEKVTVNVAGQSGADGRLYLELP